MVMYNITKNAITEYWDLKDIYRYAKPEDIVIVFENMRMYEIWKSAYDVMFKVVNENGRQTLEEINT